MSAIGGANNQIFTVSENVNVPSTSGSASVAENAARRRFKNYSKQPFLDVIIIVIALPLLTFIGLMLESMTRDEHWLQTTQSRLTVLGLGAAFATICLALCMYVTSRLGKKFLWVGPIPSDELGAPSYSYYNSREADDLPPKYDTIMDIPPPAYDSLIFEDEKQYIDAEKCPKYAIQHI